MPYMRKRGVGQTIDTSVMCSPNFVGPLTQEQQTICNLSAGIDYRDQLLSQSTPSVNPLLLWGVLGLGLFVAMRN